MISSTRDLTRSIMIVGAHADDVEIYAGGTTEKFYRKGYEVIYVMSTNNMSGNPGKLNEHGVKVMTPQSATGTIPRRKRECDDAAREWKTTPIHLDHPQRHYVDENLQKVELRYGSPLHPVIPSDVPTIITAGEDQASIDQVTRLILQKRPEVILTHGINALNPEHYATALLVVRAYWQAVDGGYKGAMLMWREPFDIFGPASTRWDAYIDISDLLDRKAELIAKHISMIPQAVRKDFALRQIDIEQGSEAGCHAAELFMWVGPKQRPKLEEVPEDSLLAELIANSR